MAEDSVTPKLGFDIDTKALKDAGDQAQKTADQISKVGDAAQKSSDQMNKATAKTVDWGKQSADAASKYDGAVTNAAKRAGVSVEDMQKRFEAFKVSGGASLNEVGNQMGKVGSTTEILGAHITALIERLGTTRGGLAAQFDVIGRSIPGIVADLGPMAIALGVATAAVGGLAYAYIRLAEATAAAQDREQQSIARLQALGGSGQGGAQATFEGIARAAEATGAPLQQMQSNFEDLQRSASRLGASTGEVTQLTTTVQKIGSMTGATQQNIAATVNALSGAFRSGRLDGQAFEAILQNMPDLAQRMASSMGMSVEALRRLANEGGVTATSALAALEQQTAAVDRQFAQLPQTAEQAAQRSATAWSRFAAQLGRDLESSGVLQFLNNFMTGVATIARYEITPLGDMVQQERARQARAAADAQAQSPQGRARATLNIGLDTASSLNTFAQRQNELTQETNRLTAAMNALRDGVADIPADKAAADMDKLQRGMQMVTAAAKASADAITQFNRQTDEMARAQLIGGGGGGTQIAQQARQMQAQMQTRGVSYDQSQVDAYNASVNRALQSSYTQIQQTYQAAEAQQRLNEAFAGGSEAVRRQQINIDVASFAFQRFGVVLQSVGDIARVADPRIRAALDAFATAQTQLSDAQRTSRVQQATRSVQESIDSINAQIGAGAGGDFNQRLAAADVARRYDQTGTGMLRMREFMQREVLQSRQQQFQLGLQTEDATMREMAANANDPSLLIRSRQQVQIRQAQRNAPPDEVDNVARQMQAKFDAERNATLAEQSASMREQMLYAQQMTQLQGQSGEQLAVNTAQLDRQRELRSQGFTLTQQQMDEQMRLTAELARANYQLEQQRQQAAEYQKIWTEAAAGIQEAITSAFDEAFTNGTISGAKALDIISNLARRIATQILQATVFTPLGNLFQNLGNQVLATALGRGFGAGIPAAPIASAGLGTTSAIQAVPASVLQASTQHSGGMAGSGTARWVDPAVFATALRYHNGGLANDEVPAILQRGERVLTANQNQALGNTNVIVNDMRSSGNAAPVETKSGQGFDGQKWVEVTIRDQTRKMLRSGELDRDMSSNYGSSRVLMRR